MALEHAILVSLAERSASGYELARRFDASIGHFWKATHQQIYRVLARMESEKWVVAELVTQHGRPDKKVYAITEDGRAELLEWLRSPTPPEQVRSEFTVKLRAAHLVDRDVLLGSVARRRAEHLAVLERYRASAEKHFADPSALTDEEVGPWLALRGGVRLEQAGIEWCDEITRTLESR